MCHLAPENIGTNTDTNTDILNQTGEIPPNAAPNWLPLKRVKVRLSHYGTQRTLPLLVETVSSILLAWDLLHDDLYTVLALVDDHYPFFESISGPRFDLMFANKATYQ